MREWPGDDEAIAARSSLARRSRALIDQPKRGRAPQMASAPNRFNINEIVSLSWLADTGRRGVRHSADDAGIGAPAGQDRVRSGSAAGRRPAGGNGVETLKPSSALPSILRTCLAEIRRRHEEQVAGPGDAADRA